MSQSYLSSQSFLIFEGLQFYWKKMQFMPITCSKVECKAWEDFCTALRHGVTPINKKPLHCPRPSCEFMSRAPIHRVTQKSKYKAGYEARLLPACPADPSDSDGSTAS